MGLELWRMVSRALVELMLEAKNLGVRLGQLGFCARQQCLKLLHKKTLGVQLVVEDNVLVFVFVRTLDMLLLFALQHLDPLVPLGDFCLSGPE
jgi:hypothetical protein